MLVRAIEYLASPGGGARFLTEMISAFRAHEDDVRFEIVSHGAALDAYRSLLPGCAFIDVPPRNQWRTRTLMRGIPGAGPLNWILRTPDFHFDVAESVFEGCDLVWLPWLSRHRIPWHRAEKVVGTLHDVILVDFDGVTTRKNTDDERETIARWLGSTARIVVDADATVTALERLFHAPRERATVIPLSARHQRPPRAPEDEPGWRDRHYVLSSANCSPHKNLDVLLQGVGRWGAKIPLVLTGAGTNLWAGSEPRRLQLRRIAEAEGFERNRTLFPLDYVSDSKYYALLENAWAVIVPTLAEGAGLPVVEAIQHGIPVIASDIPVAREMVGRVGGNVIWFNARSPEDLAAKLDALEKDYAAHKAAAVAQVKTLRARTWQDVARDYIGLMRSAMSSVQVIR